jgi:hypothetical protein
VAHVVGEEPARMISATLGVDAANEDLDRF